MKPLSCWGKLEGIAECIEGLKMSECPLRESCLQFALGKLVGKGYLVEYFSDGKLSYKPTVGGWKRSELVRKLWKLREIGEYGSKI